MKTNTTNTTTTTTDRQYTYSSYAEFIESKLSDLYTYGRYVANKCLFNKESTSAQQFITEILCNSYQDRTAQNIDEIVSRLSEHEDRHKEYARLRDEHHKKSQHITLSDTERAEHFTAYLKYKTLAEHEQEQADILTKTLETVSTDYSDLVQVALEQHTRNTKTPPQIEKHILSQYGAESAEDLTEEQRAEAQHRQNFKLCCRAVNNYMTKQLAHTTHNSHRADILEKLPTAIIEQIETAQKQFIERVGNITKFMYVNTTIIYNMPNKDHPEGVPHYFSYNEVTQKFTCKLSTGNFYTFEYKNTKKYKGWYNVYHRQTIRNISKIESYTNEKGEQQDITALQKTFTVHSTDTATDTIESRIINNKALTDKERAFINAFMSPTAERVAQHIRQAYYTICTKHNREPNSKKALQLEYNGKKAYAFSVLEKVYNITMKEDNRRQFFSRMKKHINSTKAKHTGTGTAPSTGTDLVKWTEQATATNRPNVIKWTESGTAPQPITAEERAEQVRAEQERQAITKVLQHKLELYKTLRDADRYNNSGSYSAKHSAFYFFNAMNEDEQTATAKARLQELEQLRARAEEQKKKPRITMSQYLEIVHNATAEQKAEIQARYYVTIGG